MRSTSRNDMQVGGERTHTCILFSAHCCSSVLRLPSGEYRCLVLAGLCHVMSCHVEDIYDDGGPRCPCCNIMYLPLPPLGIPYLNQNITALKAEVWVETVTEGGRRFMAAWSKEEVDAVRHRHSRRREKQRDWETCYRRRECRISRSHTR